MTGHLTDMSDLIPTPQLETGDKLAFNQTSVTPVTKVLYPTIDYEALTPEQLHQANLEIVHKTKGMVSQFQAFTQNRMLPAFRETINRLKKPGQRMNGQSDVEAYFESIGLTYANVRKMFSREKKRLLESMGWQKKPRGISEKLEVPEDRTALYAEQGLKVCDLLCSGDVKAAHDLAKRMVEAVAEDKPLVLPPVPLKKLREKLASPKIDDLPPIPLRQLADDLNVIADELRAAYELDGFADELDAIAERIEDRTELTKRKKKLDESMSKTNPDGSPIQRNADQLIKATRRDRRFVEDMRLILAAGGSTYRGMKIYGTKEEPYIFRFSRQEILAEFRGQYWDQLGRAGRKTESDEPEEKTQKVLAEKLSHKQARDNFEVRRQAEARHIQEFNDRINQAADDSERLRLTEERDSYIEGLLPQVRRGHKRGLYHP